MTSYSRSYTLRNYIETEQDKTKNKNNLKHHLYLSHQIYVFINNIIM